ncbi:MAG: mannonate dehydratase [Vicinamibacterales bacterium]|nr:mannonate dehydratase [Vicinamibacterales bacterium]MDP6607829.1 mannonate dehydratase [Vicinamibacterales bacterium]
MKRRQFFSIATLGSAALAARPSRANQAPTARMRLGTQRGPTTDAMLSYFARHGVEGICGYPPSEDEGGDWSLELLSRLREQCEAHGIALDMVQFPFMSSSYVDRARRRAIMLGDEPDRQREVDEAGAIIANCAAAGIPAVKYNLSMLGVLRTDPTPGRGGSSYSTWRLADATEGPLTRAGRVSADAMWERITYFLEQIVPVAEEHRVRLACHPHDPGVPPAGFRGIARVLGTVDGLKRFVAIRESPYHGLNLCLGTTAEMLRNPAEGIHDVIRYFGERKKIFNIHFRNIVGRRDDFQEVFPDEGDMNMVEVMRTLQAVDYPYLVMPDHLPRHDDDPGGRQAFAFGYGYIKALIQAVNA